MIQCMWKGSVIVESLEVGLSTGDKSWQRVWANTTNPIHKSRNISSFWNQTNWKHVPVYRENRLTDTTMVNHISSDYYDTSENQIYLISAAGIAAVFAALGMLI